uniref:Uncharacterized protein n=1 Tax=Glossina austeni TaxID=7395 RepID=A0A1A9V900_GLOAU
MTTTVTKSASTIERHHHHHLESRVHQNKKTLTLPFMAHKVAFLYNKFCTLCITTITGAVIVGDNLQDTKLSGIATQLAHTLSILGHAISHEFFNRFWKCLIALIERSVGDISVCQLRSWLKKRTNEASDRETSNNVTYIQLMEK